MKLHNKKTGQIINHFEIKVSEYYDPGCVWIWDYDYHSVKDFLDEWEDYDEAIEGEDEDDN